MFIAAILAAEGSLPRSNVNGKAGALIMVPCSIPLRAIASCSFSALQLNKTAVTRSVREAAIRREPVTYFQSGISRPVEVTISQPAKTTPPSAWTAQDRMELK